MPRTVAACAAASARAGHGRLLVQPARVADRGIAGRPRRDERGSPPRRRRGRRGARDVVGEHGRSLLSYGSCVTMGDDVIRVAATARAGGTSERDGKRPDAGRGTDRRRGPVEAGGSPSDRPIGSAVGSAGRAGSGGSTGTPRRGRRRPLRRGRRRGGCGRCAWRSFRWGSPVRCGAPTVAHAGHGAPIRAHSRPIRPLLRYDRRLIYGLSRRSATCAIACWDRLRSATGIARGARGGQAAQRPDAPAVASQRGGLERSADRRAVGRRPPATAAKVLQNHVASYAARSTTARAGGC